MQTPPQLSILSCIPKQNFAEKKVAHRSAPLTVNGFSILLRFATVAAQSIRV
jgi:hypothetical protein